MQECPRQVPCEQDFGLEKGRGDSIPRCHYARRGVTTINEKKEITDQESYAGTEKCPPKPEITYFAEVPVQPEALGWLGRVPTSQPVAESSPW